MKVVHGFFCDTRPFRRIDVLRQRAGTFPRLSKTPAAYEETTNTCIYMRVYVYTYMYIHIHISIYIYA